MNDRTLPAFKAAAPGVTLQTVISTSQTGTIPLTSAGTVPRMVRVLALAACYVRFRTGATVATTADCLVLPGEAAYFKIGQDTHYAVIDDGVATKVNITPLEDS